MPDFSAIILIVMAWLSSFIKPSLYMFIALVIADVELIIKGPVISINHSVSDSEKKYYHRCLIGILAVLTLLLSQLLYYTCIEQQAAYQL